MSKLKEAIVALVLLTALVSCSGGGLVPTVVEAGEEVTPIPLESEPTEITITVELPYPEDANFNPGVSGVEVTCLSGCEDRQVKTTDFLGQVELTGHLPLTVRAERSGYVTVERQVTTSSGTVVAIGHQPPPEAVEAIRQLGLEEAIASGELLIVWADTRYFTGPSRGGQFFCNSRGTRPPAVLVREWRGRDFMVNTLIHELVHAWQGRNSNNPPCDVIEGWRNSPSGRAWIEATRRDIREVGPIPGFDDDTHRGTPLSEIPHENHATLVADWCMGTSWGRNPGSVTKDDFYQMAPHRSREMEEKFGPPCSRYSR